MKTRFQATSHDIAKAANVSQATVSRVLRGNQNVGLEMRTRVMAAAKALNYSPNAHARAMRTSRVGVIGVVVARLNNPLYIDILRAVNDVASEIGLRLVLWDTEGAGEVAAIDAIRQSLVDGVIFAAATRNSPVLEEAIVSGAPVALINRAVEAVECDQVSSDNFGGAALVARYFLQHGRRRIGFITGGNEASTIRDRVAGFVETLEREGAGIESQLVRKVAFTHEEGASAMRSLLELQDPPQAVFCVNDLLALGALDAAHDMKCSVPEDCWVAGFDDVHMASWSTLSLTTVRQPVRSMVEDGVRLLLRRLDNADLPPTRIVHPANLVIRRTTGRTTFS